MEDAKALQKIDWISKAKGFGILGVIAVHTVHNFKLPSYVVSIANAGMFCVQLFFVISAYLTFKSFGKYNITSLKDYFLFVIHKIIRFIPVLYIVSIYRLVSYCIKNGIPNFTDNIWRDLFFSVSFLNGFSVKHINPWINWYIGTLVIFIFITPPLYKIAKNSFSSVIFFSVALIGAWLISIFLGFMNIKHDFFYFWFPNQFPVMMLGVILYHIEKEGIQSSKKALMLLLLVVSFCFLLSMCFSTSSMVHVRYGILLVVFAYTLFLNCDGFFYGLKILGEHSYGIYLLHWQLIPHGMYLLEKFNITRNSMHVYVLFFISIVIVSLSFSLLIKLFVEKPFFMLMKKIGL